MSIPNFFDTSYSITPVTTAGSITALNPIPEGFTDSDRIGARVVNMSLHVNQILENVSQAAATDVGDSVRSIIFWDTQANLGAPTVAQVLQNASINSFYNWDQQLRFIIIWDSTWDAPVFSQDANLGSVQNTFSDCFEIDLKEVVTTYTQGGVSVNTNSLNVLDISFNQACNLVRQVRLVYDELE